MKNIALTTLLALSFLSACTEESQTAGDAKSVPSAAENTAQSVTAQPQSQNAEQSIEETAKVLTDMLTQQKNTFDHSLNELNKAIEEVSENYEDNFNLSEENISSLAEKLGKLARQAGEGAKTLEKTGKILGDAIQKGFEEGYNKPKAESNEQQ